MLGALVEPGGNAMRAVEAANLGSGDRVIVLGPGTIGLLAAMFARAAGAEVHLLGRSVESSRSRRALVSSTLDRGHAAGLALRCGDRGLERRTSAVARTRSGGAGRPGRLHRSGGPPEPDRHPDAALKDVTAVGILSASPGLDSTIAAFASGAVDPGLSSPPRSALTRSARSWPVTGRHAGPARRSMSTPGAAERSSHQQVKPPSTRRSTPVQKLAASLSRKTAGPTSSSTVAIRRSGVSDSNWRTCSATSGRVFIGVAV